MKVLRWLNVLAVVAMLLSVLPVQAAAPAMPDKQPTQQATGGDDPLRRLQDATGGTVRVSTNDATGVANFVSLPAGALPAFKLARQEKAVATDRAQAFFKEYGGLFGIRDAGSELQLLDVAADQYGAMHVEYVQVYQGVPVFASSLRAHFDKDGQLTAVNGVFIPKVGVNTTPALSADQAAEIAVAHVENPVAQTSDAAGESRKDSGLKASGPTLYVFRANLVQGIPGANHLAYEVEVANGRDVREFVYVDAHTGAVIEQFTGMYDALNRRAFNGEANHPATPYWVEGQTFPTANTEANNVIYASGEIYNIIGSLTGGTYLSWDGADAVMDNIFNATGLTCPNAQWTGTYSRFCTGVTGDDTVGHEWGHAYTQGTHNLIYAWQSGALSESYSDVWGEVVDLLNGRGTDTPGGSRTNGSCSTYGAGTPSVDATYRWLSGEDDPSMGVIRDMWRPSCYGDPDMVSGAGYVCSTTDNGGVHTNCGVPNHAFALLVDGGTFNGQTIAGIGLTRAAHLYWRTQSVYQTPTSDFQVHADALRQSCADLTGADLRELSTVTTTTGISADKITASHCAELEKVIAAVELETEPTQCGFVPMLETPAPALCSPLETTSSVLTQDWEAGMGTWAIGTRNVAQPGSLDSLNWFVETTLPDGRAGQAAFAEDSTDKGDCSADDESSVRYLESPNITVPTGGDLRLAFDHWAAMELGWDGGNVKISVNGGAWQLVPASAFTFNAYPGTLDTLANGNTNPMAGEAAFTGANGGENSGSWGQSQVNLSGLASAGDVIKLRFEIGIDGCNGSTGWYVDTVQVYQCVAAPVGELNGTVTNASTSAPIAGAQIEAVTNPTFNATTDAAGEYAMSVIAGTYVVTASAFGYNTASASGVVVAEGAPTTQDFALTQMPAATLSGVVYDSATNWPLYASIAIDGDAGSATIWTDPETGAYSIEAPTGVSFTLEVAAWVTGYTPETLEVQLSGAATQDFALDADSAACNAPGYAIVGLSEGFESTTFPPTGWARFRGVNGLGTVQDWVRTATAYAGSGAAYVQYENVTGGLAQDWLVTPQVRPTAGSSTLSFYMRQTYGTNYGSTYTIRVSTNSQTTHGDFTTVQTYAEGDFTTTYQQFTVDLSAYVDQDIYIAFVM
ncbi:MAG TPA: M4 family metallopeptidase, partial [Anaerolineae bacterium]|nr:M4 family metallopeptidase [Anaerolineae bacterium]